MRILVASQANNVAIEDNRIQQGLLSYALFQNGLRACQADWKPKDRTLTLAEWLGYAVHRVPELSAEIRRGEIRSFGLKQARAPSR